MAKVKFIGNQAKNDEGKAVDSRDEITAFGIEFKKGRNVTVEDDRALEKLSANSHFEVTG